MEWGIALLVIIMLIFLLGPDGSDNSDPHF